jgi:AraC-like DNA-binding protein
MICYEEWNAAFRACCGNYYSEPTDQRSDCEGFHVEERFGLDLAVLNCRISRIDRNRHGIKRDDAEHFFLLCQTRGSTEITHNNREEILDPGEMVLLDSTKSAELNFEGKTAGMFSLHLPRSLCIEASGAALHAGKKVSARHPMHGSLKNLILNDGAFDNNAFHADDMFEFVSFVFGRDPDSAQPGGLSNRAARVEFIREAIDRNLGSADLSLVGLAREVGMSQRQLQRDLSQAGTSFTRLTQERRVTHLIARKRRADRLGKKISMAEHAYASGFSDQAHFNRVFRTLKRCTPTDYFAADLQT